MASYKYLFSLILVFMIGFITENQGTGNPCTCILLNECQYFKNLLMKPTQQDLIKVRKALCGIENKRYKVCCPLGILSSNCGGTYSNSYEKIFGGELSPIGMFPWMAIFEFYDKMGVKTFGCGGSLINDRYILSAAHCFVRDNIHAVRLGEWDLSSTEDCDVTRSSKMCSPAHIEQKLTGSQIVIHPQYNTRTKYSNDIALVRLKTPLNLTQTYPYIQPICLPPQGLLAKNLIKISNNLPIVAGWGRTSKSHSSNRLRHVKLKLKSDDVCKNQLKMDYLDKQICVGGEKGKDSCAGDSGSPLFIEGPRGPPFLQLGIVSFGTRHCGAEGVPAVYTSVSHYRKWIEKNILL